MQQTSVGWDGWRAVLLAALVLSWAAPTSAQTIFSDGFDDACGQIQYAESFALADGSAWPSPWQIAGGTALADTQGGAARLRPFTSGYSLARTVAPISTRDVEVLFSFRMESASTQGVGFYVRSNGGYLQQTMPTGQGYAVFVEGTFRNQAGIGLWKEENGVEIQLAHSPPELAGPQQNQVYRVRFQVRQINAAQTRLLGKFWLASGSEPVDWQITVDDATPILQNLSGGIAVDSWSVLTGMATITAHTFVDDIEIRPLCP